MDQKEVKKLLDDVGPGFCLAKWTQVTVNLGIGETQSCHHNQFHSIPVSEIKRSSSALHNTQEKKNQRKQMLTGERPKECNYCWRVEDNSDYFSDRVIMSTKFNAMDHYENIKQFTGDEDFNPTQLEISFSNVCNFACAYCGPTFSSKWASDISRHGPYINDYNKINQTYFLDKEQNPYVDAFWDYLPQVYNTLDTLRVTGGEPLMSRHTETLLNYIKEHPNHNLTLIINTNLGVPDSVFYSMIDRIKEIKEHIKEVQIATSGESTGVRAEYIRDGLDYNTWYDRCIYILSEVQIKVNFMCAYNVLSITTFTDFLKDILFLYKTYGNVGLSVTSVAHPEFLSVTSAPVEWRHYLVETLEFLETNAPGEISDRFKHVLAHFDTGHSEESVETLTKFLVEYDKRRGKDFKTTFPEYSFIKF